MMAKPSDGFGDVLRRARRAAGLSQEALAERAGVSARAVSDLERGVNRTPRLDTLQLIAVALDLTADERATWMRLRRTLADRRERSTAGPRGAVSARVSPSSIPTPLTAVVGREREIAEIARRLETGVRLLTLTGPGGVGKTRLSIAVAHVLADAFGDGIWFVDLSTLRDPELVLPTIAATLGIVFTGDRPALDDLTAVLQHQHRLLVLDNLEQVIVSASSLEALLTACPRLSLLATSRVPLRVHGEQEFPLAALELPAHEESHDPDAALRSEAVRLFVARAQAIRPEFQLSDATAPLVSEICTRLDGLPLAIELAAARLRALSPADLLQRLAGRLDLLVDRSESSPARQRTMRDTIQWSYDLLSPEQQRLFRELSVFAGGARLEAIEQVVGRDGQDDLLDPLEELVQHSLVQTRTQPDGTTRYVLLETIRAFGSEQLVASDELDDARDRHADYFRELVLAGGDTLHPRDTRAWLDLLEPDHDNLRAALDHLRAQRDTTRGLPLVAALGRFWLNRGPITEGRFQTERLLSLTGAADRTEERAEALRSLTGLAAYQGDADAAVQAGQEALDIFKERGSTARLPAALLSFGIACAVRGDAERATALWRDTVVAGRETGDIVRAGLALNNLAVTARSAGDLDNAAASLREALALFREAGHEENIPLALSNLAAVTLDTGRVDEAHALALDALALSVDMNERPMIVTHLFGLAAVERVRERLELATRLLGAAEALRESIGGMLPMARSENIASERAVLLAALGAEAFDAAWSEGLAMSIEQAVAEAVQSREAS